MRITDILEMAAAATREIKEHACRSGPDDTHPQIQVFRANEPVALVTLMDLEVEDVAKVAWSCASGFDADEIAITVESYEGAGSAFRRPNINPLTGQEWRSGEMAAAVAEHDAIARGWIIESMLMLVANRAGDLASSMQPFSFVDGQIVWGTPKVMSTVDGWEGVGYLPETMRAMMLHPSASVNFPADITNFNRDQRDILTAQYLTTQGDGKYAIALYSGIKDEERVEALRKIGRVM